MICAHGLTYTDYFSRHSYSAIGGEEPPFAPSRTVICTACRLTCDIRYVRTSAGFRSRCSPSRSGYSARLTASAKAGKWPRQVGDGLIGPRDPGQAALVASDGREIGRASCRERVWISEGEVDRETK